MADKRVTDLTAIDGATLAAADLFHVVDVSDTTDNVAGTSKKMLYSELVAKILGGTAATATALATARNINGVSFNGTADITVTAAAGTLTGTTLNSTVVTSSLTSVGTLSALNVGGVSTLTSNSASALAVGANGATNPVLKVNAATASVATGIEITGAAAAGGVVVQAISSGADEGLTIRSKGAGGLTLATGTGANALVFQSNAATRFSITNAQYSFSGLAASSTASSARFNYVATANTALTASTEWLNVHFNNVATQQHATGAITLQRDFLITAATHTAVASSTITDAASFAVTGAPVQGTNVLLTNSSTIYSAGGAVGANTTNSYGINIAANTGATNNYIARFAGSAGEVFRLRTDGQIAILATNTAAGTTGAQTINRPSGKVNFAAAATSLVVTNSLVTANSIVIANVLTDDATMFAVKAVPAACSFTLTANAAAAAETAVGFLVIN